MAHEVLAEEDCECFLVDKVYAVDSFRQTVMGFLSAESRITCVVGARSG